MKQAFFVIVPAKAGMASLYRCLKQIEAELTH